MRIYIITDFNTSKRFKLEADIGCDEAFRRVVASLGDFPHMVEEMADADEVQDVFGCPLAGFPTLP